MTKSTRFYSDKQETGVAKKLGGQVQIGSGSTPFYKADVTTKDFCIECKTKVTESGSISLKKEWFEKLKEQSFAQRKKAWSLVFSFGDGVNYYAIDEALFKKLLKYMEDEEK